MRVCVRRALLRQEVLQVHILCLRALRALRASRLAHGIPHALTHLGGGAGHRRACRAHRRARHRRARSGACDGRLTPLLSSPLAPTPALALALSLSLSLSLSP